MVYFPSGSGSVRQGEPYTYLTQTAVNCMQTAHAMRAVQAADLGAVPYARRKVYACEALEHAPCAVAAGVGGVRVGGRVYSELPSTVWHDKQCLM